jgi:hypothetical protein
LQLQLQLQASVLSPHLNTVISTEGGALCPAVEKSAVAVAVALAVVCSLPPPLKPVISTEGGALAAAVEKSAVSNFHPN